MTSWSASIIFLWVRSHFSILIHIWSFFIIFRTLCIFKKCWRLMYGYFTKTARPFFYLAGRIRANLSNFFRSWVILGCVTSTILTAIIPTTNQPTIQEASFLPFLSEITFIKIQTNDLNKPRNNMKREPLLWKLFIELFFATRKTSQ